MSEYQEGWNAAIRASKKIADQHAHEHHKAEQIYADRNYADGHIARQQCRAAVMSVAHEIGRLVNRPKL